MNQKPDSSEGHEPAGAATHDRPASDSANCETSRYRVVEAEDETYITCNNTPNISLYVERGLVVDAAARKRYPKRTIFLDGAYTEAPFFDNEALQYSLDHHAGCVRSFTLATCEQAVVMLLEGLPLDEGDWRIYVNDPDLDALLAAWVLLNHGALTASDNEFLRHAMPFIRVEGTIDAHGLDMDLLTALPQDVYDAHKRHIDGLRELENKYKAAGEWQTIDFHQYSCNLLHELDRALFLPEQLAQLVQINEVTRRPLRRNKFAILCRSRDGIYQVERLLKQRYGKQLGVIVLDQGNGRFTLRQIDPFLQRSLHDVYPQLNEREANNSASAEPDNHWGGSDIIGGSPRKAGSNLQGEEILRIVQRVYGAERGWFRRLMRRVTS